MADNHVFLSEKEGFADLYFFDSENEPKVGGTVSSDQDPPVPL